MSRNRFLEIMRYLHCNDNQTAVPMNEEGYDPLHKVSPAIDLLNGSFSTNYNFYDKKVQDYEGQESSF
ncbi:hypothetical protein KUTeg_002714 [Tegillarca granosa]|uniref:PiggyBac transposable element-derived protein domain-containing protein n=1 Tax=Tegillarca granosa TaxID=220873 RepID=A0ABQ9FR43_TEGGR|nr:hypothetical protein KUTeg_002714 [Tegillarca granosa]